jgi:hypothetical protein
MGFIKISIYRKTVLSFEPRQRLGAHEIMRCYIIWKGLGETKILEAIKKARGTDYNKDWAKQRSVWEIKNELLKINFPGVVGSSHGLMVKIS